MSDPKTASEQARAVQFEYEIGIGDESGVNDEEPPLHEVLVDPIVHRLMERDGVQLAELISLIGKAKNRLR
jgi:hypothetical protein